MTDLDYVERILASADGGRRRQHFHHNPRLAEILPEIRRLKGVPQPPEYHPEGDVLTHTLLALDYLPAAPDRRLAWAVLLHDVGKALTTRQVRGRLRAFGHDRQGAELAARILARLGMEETAARDVIWLVRHHMFALSWQVSEVDALSSRQWRFVGDPRFPLLLDLLEIDARASGGRSEKRALVAFYREARRRLEAGGVPGLSAPP